MKSNVPLLNVLDTNYKKATIYISELILTPFSPFDIKCKKLNANRDNPGEISVQWSDAALPRNFIQNFILI